MRVRAVITVALAVVAVAILMAMPASAAKGGTERPQEIGVVGFQIGAFYTAEHFRIRGPAVATGLGKLTVRTVTDDKGEHSVYTAANGDKFYSESGEKLSIPSSFECPVIPGYDAQGGPFPFRTMLRYTGGTGRFVNATGTAITSGCFHVSEEGGAFATYAEEGTLTERLLTAGETTKASPRTLRPYRAT